MPIINTPLTKTQFQTLQDNITQQVATVSQGSVLALSGLTYLVGVDVDAPEVDLVNPFYGQVQRMDNLNQDQNWVPVVASMNAHVVLRGTPPTGSNSDRLNVYLENGGNRIMVSAEYARLSAVAGYIISNCYITPGDAAGCLPGITSASSDTGTHNVAYSFTVTAVGTPTITFAATGLPSGLSINASTGVISGTTASTGVSSVTITATNSLGDGTQTFTLTMV